MPSRHCSCFSGGDCSYVCGAYQRGLCNLLFLTECCCTKECPHGSVCAMGHARGLTDLLLGNLAAPCLDPWRLFGPPGRCAT